MYVGRIASVPDEAWCFITRDSLKNEDGSLAEVETSKDIYLHRRECSCSFKPGAWMRFDLRPDQMRGGNALRAFDATQTEEPILAPVASIDLVEPVPEDTMPAQPPLAPIPQEQSLVVVEPVKFPAAPARPPMKKIAKDALEKVAKNNPLSGVPRENVETRTIDDVLLELLPAWFAHIPYFGREIEYNSPEEYIEQFLRTIDEKQGTSYFSAQRKKVRADLQKFLSTRQSLTKCLAFMNGQGMLRQDTVLPISLLPDLFMPAPVWYFRYGVGEAIFGNKHAWFVHPRLRRTCDLIPTPNWASTFLLFNRHLRTFDEYRGEEIHPQMADRINNAAEVFDEVVIATPYFDHAGPEWEEARWQNGIDPFVYAFNHDVPLVFVLGRLSGTDTFDLYNELVADTVSFLMTNAGAVKNFAHIDKGRSAYWYFGNRNLWRSGRTWERTSDMSNVKAKQKLVKALTDHITGLTAAFDRGRLFDWLRGKA